MKKTDLSSLQMILLIYPTIIATGILSVPRTVVEHAGNELWLAPIIGSVLGFLTVYITYELHKRYPNETVIQFSEHIVGRILGKVISFFIMFSLLHTTGEITRAYSAFLSSSYLFDTPTGVVMGSMIFLCAIVVYLGVEVLARVGQVFFPFFFLPLLTLVLLLIPDYDVKNILPIFEQGLMPSIKGSIIEFGWYGQFFLMIFFLPFLSDKNKGMKYGMFTVLAIMLTFVIVNLVSLFVLGPSLQTRVYPLMNVSRYISIAGFFENLEAVAVAIWIIGAFIKISVFYYAASLSVAQWFELSDYRIIVWPLAILVMAFGFWALPNSVEYNEYLNRVVPFYVPTVFTIIPLCLLIIDVIRKRNKKQEKSMST